MFLVTFPCAYECFSVKNNLRTHSVIEFSFVRCEYGEICTYVLDTFRITGRKMFYEINVFCITGKVSNNYYFRHYTNLVHFLPQLK